MTEVKKNKKIFIGVAWPYINGDIHVGHLAGYLIPCDIFARYCRLRGYNVLMVSGADCHGTPITVEAEKRGITPKELVKEYAPRLNELIKLYQTSYDIFTTTTTKNHKKVTQQFFLNLLKNGLISKKQTEQYYSPAEKRFLPDRYVEGKCSYCHAIEQRSDQCENCGRVLVPGELINPYSKLTKTPVTFKKTEHYFFDCDKLQKEITEYIKKSAHWRKWIRKETLGWLKEGLQPRAITRDIDWGVNIPQENIPKHLLIKNIEHKKFYVWFEAVIGYFSASLEWSKKTNGNWRDFWENINCRHYYFMGKDNLVFHTIFWPAQLMGQKANYNLPYFPAINHFLTLEKKKFSKSRGVYLDSIKIGKYFGTDLVKFYIASILPEKNDSDWQWKGFKENINGELINNIGNFIHRTLTFYKNKLPQKFNQRDILDQEVKKKSKITFKEINEEMMQCNFSASLKKILSYSQFANQYFDGKKPWNLLQKDKKECQRVIYNCLQIVYSLRTLLYPFIPNSMDRLSEILGLAPLDGTQKAIVDNFQFQKLKVNKIKISNKLEPLFRKIEDSQIKEFKSGL